MRLFLIISLVSALAFGRTEFWAPVAPPRAQYAVDVKFDGARLEGTETIKFRNETARPMGRLALQWFGDVLRVRVDGAAAERVPGTTGASLFDLPREIAPGSPVELNVEFGAPWKPDEKNGAAVTSFLSPRLWWGFNVVGDYEVRVTVPAGYAAATSGRLDEKTGAYRASGVRVFGLFVGKGYESLEAEAGDVRVRAVFTAKGRPCAELLVKTAVDVVGFYRQRFGFYPHRSISIVPGMDNPAGGYPVATALVVVHGQERLAEPPEAFWRWITAHEIGHMYWSDHVLTDGTDSLSWLMIGLGIYADREYRRARGIGGATGALEMNYVNGVRQGYDTTMDVTAEQLSSIRWGFNNIVTHGKSAAMLNALEAVMGTAAFDRVYRKCLTEFAGRRLGWRDFQRAVEFECGQDLDWFFEQWVRSSRNVFYKVAGTECKASSGAFDCAVRVERTGEMRMPVTVAARFEDGTVQRARTERLVGVDELRFQAKSPVKEAVIEPDGAVAMAEPPSAAVRAVLNQVRNLPYTGAGEPALAALRQAREMKIEDAATWRRLAMVLYDAKYYAEALEVMQHVEQTDAQARFMALVWQGHVLDLLGRREEALAKYQSALEVPGAPSMQHSQYNLIINKDWVRERLNTPFERR